MANHSFSIRVDNRKQTKFPSKHIVVLGANVCGQSRLQKRRKILADYYMNHVPNWRQRINFLFSANRKANLNIIWMWDPCFPISSGKQRGHDLKILRTTYRTKEGISILIGWYQSKGTKPKFVKIWMPAQSHMFYGHSCLKNGRAT